MTDPARPPLLQLCRVTEAMRAELSAHFTVDVLGAQPDRAAHLATHGSSYACLLTDGHIGVPDDVAAALPNLQVVSSYGVGYDAINAPALTARGIQIAHTPGVLNDEVAVTAIGLWLMAYRQFLPADAHARSGAWEAGAFPLARSPMDRRVGILGMGRIGQTMARMLQVFRPELHYHSRSPKDLPYAYHPTARALAHAVEVLVVITPGGAGTRHLVDAEVLEALGPDGLLINVARGSVVDEAALAGTLQAGRLGMAALDVFEDEPRIPAALKGLGDRVVLTPHIGSATQETRAAMGALAVRNLVAWLETGRVETPVPESAHLPVDP